MSESTERRISLALIVALVLLGVACRLRQYLARTSYWNDEAFIVLNIVDHPASHMLGPLDYNQAAPPAFMWIERAAAVTWGFGEYSLRLFPLVAGLTALGLFAPLAWRVLPGAAAVLAVGWFAFAEKLVGYCAEVKQYSSDALVAVVLLLAAVGTGARWTAARRFLIVSAIAAVAVWLSHPAAIVFGALSLALALPCLREGRGGRIAWVGGNLLVVASFALLYRFSIIREQDPFLYRFWADGFPPAGHPLQVPRWLGQQLWELARQPFPQLWALTAALALLGIAELVVRRGWVLLAACVAPVVLTIIAAFDRKYPFSPSRLTMFLLPGLLLLCGAGAAFLTTRLRRPWNVLGCALPAVLLGYGAATAGGRVAHPHFRSHMRPAAQYVRAHRRPGDVLYVLGQPHERHLEFFCYWRHPDPPLYAQFPSLNEIPHGRFWIVYAFAPGHPVSFIEPVLSEARTVAAQRAAIEVKEGAAAYLFERP